MRANELQILFEPDSVALMEYFAELLAGGDTDLLPKILEHLKGCPNCEHEYREVLHRLAASQTGQPHPFGGYRR